MKYDHSGENSGLERLTGPNPSKYIAILGAAAFLYGCGASASENASVQRGSTPSAVSSSSRVLHIGDSHVAGYYGQELERRLEAEGAEVATYGCRGARANNYLTGDKACINSTFNGVKKTDKIRSIDSLLREHNPDVVIVSLGSNYLTRPKQSRKLVEKLQGRKVYWIGPPHGANKTMSELNAFYKQLNAIAGDVTVIDARKYTPSNTDDIHFKRKDGEAWAGGVFAALQGSGGQARRDFPSHGSCDYSEASLPLSCFKMLHGLKNPIDPSHKVLHKRHNSGPHVGNHGKGWNHVGALDISAKVGTPVYAAADGIAVRVDNVDDSDGGKQIRIRHDGLERSGEEVQGWYLHLNETAVSAGQKVKAGDLIGYVGHTGIIRNRPNAAHLHLEFVVNNQKMENLMTGHSRDDISSDSRLRFARIITPLGTRPDTNLQTGHYVASNHQNGKRRPFIIVGDKNGRPVVLNGGSALAQVDPPSSPKKEVPKKTSSRDSKGRFDLGSLFGSSKQADRKPKRRMFARQSR